MSRHIVVCVGVFVDFLRVHGRRFRARSRSRSRRRPRRLRSRTCSRSSGASDR